MRAHDRFADVLLRRFRRALVLRAGDERRRARPDAGERRPDEDYSLGERMTAEAGGRRPAEHGFPKRHRVRRRGSRGSGAGSLRRRGAHDDRTRRPVLVVDPGDPGEKRDELGDLLVRQPQVGHQAPVPLFRVEPRRILEKLAQVHVAPLLGDLGQVWSVVRALAEQRVTVDAVLAVPHVLAGDDIRRDGFRVRQFGELHVAVDREPDEDRREQRRPDNEEQSRLPFGHSDLTSGTDARWDGRRG